MIDGVKIYCRINDFEAWKQSANIELYTPTDLETGATKAKLRTINGRLQQTVTHQGSFGTYRVTIKETTVSTFNGTRSVSYALILEGSLHKNYFGGANYLPFSWHKLQKELTNIETGLLVSGDLAQLTNIEIGINIPVPFEVFTFLKQNLIAYKGNAFNRYRRDKNGVCLGYVCDLKQYSVKIYDKGRQFELPQNLMRFELRYTKMQIPTKEGIKVFDDLKNQEQVNGLLKLLLNAWDNVLLFDSSINLSDPQLKSNDRKLLGDGRRPGYWEDLKEKDKRNFNYQRAKFRELVIKYGQGWNEKVKELIIKEWKNLFKNCTILPSVQNPDLNNFTVKVKGKNVQFLESIKGTEEFSYIIKKRFCLSCGRDISNQDRRSKFCSANFVGEAAAHRCRNKNSNPRNNFKRKVEAIKRRGLLFDITPFFVPVNTGGIREKTRES